MRNSGIGFIGLGQMGLGMANNLAKIATPFYAYDAVPAATDRLDGDDVLIASVVLREIIYEGLDLARPINAVHGVQDIVQSGSREGD